LSCGPFGILARLVADAPRLELPSQPSHLNRGARIRTGDLCDPNAALYRTEPRPEPTRVCLFLAPAWAGTASNGRGGIELRAASPCSLVSVWPSLGLVILRLELRSKPTPSSSLRSNGRGGIRTHAGVNPHDFQSCALSHSATRPTLRGRPRDTFAGSCPGTAVL
jgi:hypothetical protein